MEKQFYVVKAIDKCHCLFLRKIIVILYYLFIYLFIYMAGKYDSKIPLEKLKSQPRRRLKYFFGYLYI